MQHCSGLWNMIRHLFRKNSNGRPPKHPLRDIFMACLYFAREGIRWSALPDSFPPTSTVLFQINTDKVTNEPFVGSEVKPGKFHTQVSLGKFSTQAFAVDLPNTFPSPWFQVG